MIRPVQLREARARMGLTQIQAAIAIGVSYPAYRLWEMGGTKPSSENEKKLRRALEIEEEASNGDRKHGSKTAE